MKKLISLMIAAIMLLSLAACGEAPDSSAAETEPPETSAPKTEDGRPVTEVTTVDELLDAIAPDTVIELTGQRYMLTEASNYGTGSGSGYYRWDTGDGAELVIENVTGLTIRAANRDTCIVTEPRWVNVLHFIGCEDITLEGFTAGHTDGAYCSGGVLCFENTKGVTVDGCSLYGCGTEGVTTYSCEDVAVTGSEIWNCSQGAAFIYDSKNVSFDNCDFHGITAEFGMFRTIDSDKFALLNSTIRDSSGDIFFNSSRSSGVYIGGCEVSGNKFRDMFASELIPVTVEGCALGDNDIIDWYADMEKLGSLYENSKAVDHERNVYSYSELQNMQKTKNAVWNAYVPEVSTPEVAVSEDGKVHVTTVDEFLAAIAPDTTIYLEPGVYDLSTAAGCGVTETDRYRWDLRFDGPSLVITGVDGLTIEGAGAESVTIAAVPRYADVLGFERCAGLTLRGFTAGHTEEKGYCTGGVLYFDLCDDAVIDGCALFGCGIMGITASNCDDMNVSNTEIYDCEYGAVTLNDSNAVFDSCDIHDNGGPDFQLYGSTAIVDGKEQTA
uniref:right-handed parallel beta-helix repeat-containing protein n=1 Tax=Candidatus Limivicinus sp. TaxID=3030905 RepID=UPI003FF0740D